MGHMYWFLRTNQNFSEGKLESSRKNIREGSYKDRWGLVEEKEGAEDNTGNKRNLYNASEAGKNMTSLEDMKNLSLSSLCGLFSLHSSFRWRCVSAISPKSQFSLRNTLLNDITQWLWFYCCMFFVFFRV